MSRSLILKYLNKKMYNNVLHFNKGFEKNELRWSGGNASSAGFESISIHFCCRNGSSYSPTDAHVPSGAAKSMDGQHHGQHAASHTYPLPYYLRSVPTFATLMLGGSCPDYTDQGNKLTADFVSWLSVIQSIFGVYLGKLFPVKAYAMHQEVKTWYHSISRALVVILTPEMGFNFLVQWYPIIFSRIVHGCCPFRVMWLTSMRASLSGSKEGSEYAKVQSTSLNITSLNRTFS